MYRLGSSESGALSATGPSHLLVFNTLLFPLVASGNLFVCTILNGRSFNGTYFLLGALAFLLANLVLDRAGVHVSSGNRAWLHELIDITLRWMFIVLLLATLSRLGELTQRFDNAVLLSWVISTPLGMWITQIAMRIYLQRNGVLGRDERKAVIVGVNDVGLRLERQINASPVLGMRVVGFFEDRAWARLPADTHPRIRGTSADLAAYIQTENIHIVYIAIPMTRQQRIIDLLDRLRDSTASIYFVPDLFVFNLIQARLDSLGGIPLIAVCESPFHGMNGLAKRAADLIIASVAVVLVSPLLLVAAAGVKLTSTGTVLFRQRRYGLDGQPITVYKFRSMYVTEDGGNTYKQAVRGDTRVTPLGAFIRRTSIDELPQLLNVLEGSMSLVGPRPHVVSVNEEYRRLIPGYMVRHKVRPGITGWAQVNGYRGGDDLETMTKRIECDLEYLRTWSMSLDIRILFRTFALIWHDRNAF